MYRQKTARVITYEEFQQALQELAFKRFRDQSQDDAFQSICKLVEGQGPANVGVTVRKKPLRNIPASPRMLEKQMFFQIDNDDSSCGGDQHFTEVYMNTFIILLSLK